MSLWQLVCRECGRLCRDQRLLGVLLVAPIVYTVLFGCLYRPARVTHIPTWVIDQDGSAFSRNLTQALGQGDTLAVVQVGGALEEFRAATRRGEAFVCVVIPPHCERDAKHGRPVRVLTILDTSNFIIANSAMRASMEVTGTYGIGVQMQRLSLRGTPSAYAQGAAMPVDGAMRYWYNPAFNYLDFMLPGLLLALIQQVTLLAAALGFARELEEGTLSALGARRAAPSAVLAAKMLVYAGVNWLMAVFSFLLARRCFGLSWDGDTGLFLGILAVFVLGLTACGLLVSAVTRQQLFTTQVLMLVSVPSFLLSGYTWPQLAMSPGILALSNVLPLTHGVLALRAIVVQQADLGIVRPHLLWLWTFAVVSLLGAYAVTAYLLRVPQAAAAPRTAPKVV